MSHVSHELKIWPHFFEEVSSGRKTFEVRRDDRAFKAGDRLLLQEWEPGAERYTGRDCYVTVLYVCSLRPFYDAVGMTIRRVGIPV